MRARDFANTKLVIFDIDDTLVNTDTKVNVVKDGQVIKQLNSHDFTHYHLQPGEEFDFGAFRDAREFYTQARPIPGMIRQLKQDIATGNKVIMLTARSDFNDREVFLDTFRQYGIDMSKVHVYRAGNLNIKAATEEKKKIILQHLLGKTHYDKVIMYDDSVPNLNAFLSLKQDYPWSKFYAWHVDPSGRADEYHRTDIKITEVNAPGELSVDPDLIKKFTDRGYQIDGEGSDQLVLSRPGSPMVLKIVGAGSTPRKDIIGRYVNFFRRHQGNPHFPRVGSDKELRWNDQRYYMYSQERLHDFEGGDDGEIRDYLEQLMALSWVRHTLKDQPPDLGELPQGLSEEQVKGLLAAVALLYKSGIAGKYGYDLGNSYNIMQRTDGTLVIVDPFSDPEVEDLDETMTEDSYNGIAISMEREDDEIMVRASAGGKQLGSVLFVDYDGYLMPQDLEVDDRFRGQGIAAAMYDYVKSQGYRIRRSGQQTDAGRGFWGKHRPEQNVWEQGVAEGVPLPGPSSGAPKQFGADAEIQTRQMTAKDIIASVPGVPYYNNVIDDWDAKDYSWGVTKKVIEYATYLKQHPESLSKLPPAIVLNGKFEDGAHRVSALWLLQKRMDPKNPLWANAKLDVQFVKQGVAENFADGKNPGRKGLSRRVGIPKKATLGQLEKIAKSSTGERRRMAQWQLNMRRGKAKKNK